MSSLMSSHTSGTSSRKLSVDGLTEVATHQIAYIHRLAK